MTMSDLHPIVARLAFLSVGRGVYTGVVLRVDGGPVPEEEEG